MYYVQISKNRLKKKKINTSILKSTKKKLPKKKEKVCHYTDKTYIFNLPINDCQELNKNVPET